VRKILSATAFNVVLNEVIAGGLPRADGRPGCMIAIRPGANMVPDELLEHSYLRSHLDAGSVTLPDVDEPPPRTVSKYLRDDFHPADRADLPNPFGDATQQITEPTPTDVDGAF
jgi:hypothetical protein